MTDTCYMCDDEATGNEHVPPKCFFPKSDRLRHNLITVPSCDAHNSKKSKDDEYLRAIVCIFPGVNAHAIRIFSKKVMRGMERRPHHLDTFYPELTPIHTPLGETAICSIDLPRFETAIGRIARALYFHSFKEKLDRPLWVVSNGLYGDNLSITPFHSIISHGEKILPRSWRGHNQNVFAYSVDKSVRDQSKFICRLRFYDGALIYVGSKK